MTTVEQIIHALHGQESDFGRADTSKPNYANARGPMQVTDKLFKGLQQTGVIPADWSHANPDHTTEAAKRHVKALYDKFAGDPRKVAAAYYAGEKAVTNDGSIVDFKDLEGERRFAAGVSKYRPPSTLEYVDKVSRRLGLGGQAPVARPPQPAIDPAKDFENLRAGVVPGATIAVPVEPAGPLPMGSPVVAPVDAGSQAVTAANQGQLARDQIITQEGRGGAFGLAVEQSFGVQLMERLFRDEAEPDGTVASPEELRKARTGQEALDLQAAQSAAERNAVRFRNDEREYSNRAMSEFPVAALVGSAMDPVAFAAGFGVSGALAKAGIGSLVLRQAGKPLAAAASTLGENVGVNVALEGGLQALQGEIRPEDLAAAAIVGGVLSAPGAIMNYRGATRAADQAAMRAAEAEVLRQEQSVIATAQSRLGADAGPAELAAEVSRVRREGMAALVSDAAGPIDQSRRILPRENDAVAASPFDDPAEDVVVEAPRPRFMATAGQPAATSLPTPGEMDAWNRLSPARLSRDAKREKNRPTVEASLGRTIEEAEALPPGVHLDPTSTGNKRLEALAATAEYLRAKFMPELRVVFRPDLDMNAPGGYPGAQGFFMRAGKDVAVIALGRGIAKPRMVLVHEIGHAVLVANWAKAAPNVRAAMAQWHEKFLQRYQTSGGPDQLGRTPAERAALERGLPDYPTNRADPASGASLLDQLTARVGDQQARSYLPDFDEMGAEQFRKYLVSAIDRGDEVLRDAPDILINWVKDLWARFAALFKLAKRDGLLDADESFQEFFKQAAKDAEAFRAGGGFRPAGTNGLVRPMRLAGIEALPDETPADRAQKKALRHLHEKASKWAVENPKDAKWDERADRIIAKAPALMSSSLTLLRSENPVARMLAAELLEDASGVLGKRQATAAISKHVLERAFMGNAVNEVEDAYNLYAGMSAVRRVVGDLGNGQKRAEFNELVAAEIEARGVGKTGNVGPQRGPILAAADAIEGAFERMRQEQIRAEVLGFANLPDTSRGYLPHRLNQAKLAAATELERQGLRQMMVDQFMTIEGWDEAFSRDLAGRYVDAVRHRSMGGYDAPVTLGFGGSMDVVREALEAAGLAPDEIRARIEQLSVGAAGHTKTRIRLDINKTYMVNGQAINLRQFFDTDPTNLVRTQAMRVSGEVALARFGVHGRPGLDLLRKALEYGNMDPGDVPNAVYPNATADELRAFTQVAAEFLAVPVDGRAPSLFLERARGLTSLVKLGGAVWNQVGEITNVVSSIGAARSFEFVRDLPRMRSEILALARGEKNTNPILGSLEQLRDGVGGAEFGLDAYKLAMPYDRQDFHNPAYRADEVTLVDRLIRGGGHLQAKLSLFRAVHSAQVRGTAEHMVRMFAEYTRTGRDAVALDQAGFSEVSARLKASGDFDLAFKFDASGRLTEVDVGMIENLADREAFVSAVHRASQQIIQGTFIGETGRWVHDDVLKTMLQFRAFSVTAVEKQWGRQRNSRGLAGTLGLMLGTMSIAAPIYMLRTYLASIGREDQEEYLERRLSMYEIGKNTMNYIALSGLAPDFLEVAGAIAPEDFREALGMPAGGRYGAGGTAIGGLVAPSAGLANDAWNLMKDPSFDAAGKILPMSRLPAIVPALNALGD